MDVLLPLFSGEPGQHQKDGQKGAGAHKWVDPMPSGPVCRLHGLSVGLSVLHRVTERSHGLTDHLQLRNINKGAKYSLVILHYISQLLVVVVLGHYVISLLLFWVLFVFSDKLKQTLIWTHLRLASS